MTKGEKEMRYYGEFMRACRMTTAIVFTVAVLKVGVPLLFGGEVAGPPLGILLGLICTTLVCLILFTAMNIMDTKLRAKKAEKEERGE